MKLMTPIHLIRTVCVMSALAAAPIAAQDVTEEEQGRSLMEEGARLFFEGIQREMGPALEGLRDRAQEMEPALGPALRDLMGEIGDLSAFHAPEVLPNGDILLRRKTPQEMQESPVPDGEIEL